ncbi:MAG TPA: HAMP domain-containing sensor histidine kinase [Solirubrobacteraceae bacterium]|nr:HAMP domain-containing sensor histidine kinase [Solirubrobacteraceae bacterium]
MECFAAYAAHELRREITLQLALAGMALADPDADADVLREMGEDVVSGCKRQERLLEALLTLARSEYGQVRRERIDLAATAADVMRAHSAHPLRRVTALEPAVVLGNPELVERLVTNLVENALRHNVPHGRVDLATRTSAGRAILTIANTGPVIPASEVARLFRPFERLRSHPGHTADGVGLGLAIVQAIADDHEAIVHASARAGGGLSIDISFPLLSRGLAAARPPLRATA